MFMHTCMSMQSMHSVLVSNIGTIIPKVPGHCSINLVLYKAHAHTDIHIHNQSITYHGVCWVADLSFIPPVSLSLCLSHFLTPIHSSLIPNACLWLSISVICCLMWLNPCLPLHSSCQSQAGLSNGRGPDPCSATSPHPGNRWLLQVSPHALSFATSA